MEWLANLIRRGLAWLKTRFARRYKTRWVHDILPRVLNAHTVYVVQDEDVLWQVSFVCPCGCNEILHMNLISDEHPYWRITEHSDSTISLSPSVWRQKGCRSHFWLRHGKIEWCE